MAKKRRQVDHEEEWEEQFDLSARRMGAIPVSVRRYARYGSSKCGCERTKCAMPAVTPHLLYRRSFVLEGQDVFSDMTDEPEALESVQMDGEGPLRYTFSRRDKLGEL